MKVREAQALRHRVTEDRRLSDIALTEALDLYRGWVVLHAEGEQVGQFGPEVARKVEQALRDARRAVQVLERSLEVTEHAVWLARQEAGGESHRKPVQRVCAACDSPEGEPHLDWCPVVTGTLSTLPKRS